MLRLFDVYASLFRSWRVVRYEQEGDAYMLQLSAVLLDGSRLELRDYLFADGSRKYAYQWMEADRTLRRRWDNAPHWPDVATAPHHVHLQGQDMPELSTVTNLEDLLGSSPPSPGRSSLRPPPPLASPPPGDGAHRGAVRPLLLTLPTLTDIIGVC